MFIKSLLNMLMIQVIKYLSGHPFNWITFNEKYNFYSASSYENYFNKHFQRHLYMFNEYKQLLAFTFILLIGYSLGDVFPRVSEETGCGYSSFGFYSLFFVQHGNTVQVYFAAVLTLYSMYSVLLLPLSAESYCDSDLCREILL